MVPFKGLRVPERLCVNASPWYMKTWWRPNVPATRLGPPVWDNIVLGAEDFRGQMSTLAYNMGPPMVYNDH